MMALEFPQPESNSLPGEKRNIRGLTMPVLAEWLEGRGEKPFRVRQIFQWLYQQRVRTWEEMTNLSKSLRIDLAEHFHLGELECSEMQHSTDGSIKFLFTLGDGARIETVLMPNNTHHTVCVSTQVGCAMGCRFCATAGLGLTRNLDAGENLAQVVAVSRYLAEDKIIRNLVFMGMGEPLHNYDNLMAALDILQDDHAFNLSSRRLTVSTSGLVPAIKRFARDKIRVNLAVSLNAVSDEVRTALMPVNKRWNIEALLGACREIPFKTRDRITFEYVMLEGLTDSLADARKLVKLLHGFKCKINLIPYNPFPGSPYVPPPMDRVVAFQRLLLEKGMLATVRISKGQDIQAACGQLANTVGDAPQVSEAVLPAG